MAECCDKGRGRGDSERRRGGEGECSRPGSATAAIFHGADIRFRSTIAAKHKQKWRTRGEDEGEGRDDEGGMGDTERKRKMGKTEIKCRETEGTARRKKDDRLDDTTAVPSSIGSSFSLFISLFFFLPFPSSPSLLRLRVTRVDPSSIIRGASLRFSSAL